MSLTDISTPSTPPTLAERMAAARELTDPSTRSPSTEATPVEYMLVLYIKSTARGSMSYEAQFRVLYNWLSPFTFPATRSESSPRHFLTTTNLMRYMAGYFSISVTRLQAILSEVVYPLLGDSYEY